METTLAETIVKILARCDALRVPHRDPGPGGTWAAAYVARQALPATGINWGSALTGLPAGSPLVHSQLRDLEAKGLIVRIGRGTTRTLGVLLTPYGDEMARLLCNLPTRDDGLEFVQRLAALAEDILDHDDGRRWIPETKVVDATPDRWDPETEHKRKLVDTEDAFLAAAVNGWCESNANMRRHVSYALTDAGSQAAASLGPVGHLTGIEADEDLRALYLRELAMALDELRHVNAGQEIGPIPLPCSMPSH